MAEEPDRRSSPLAAPDLRLCWVLVEGQTEETFVDLTLAPHLRQFGWDLRPLQLTTGRAAGGTKYRGGVSSWQQIRGDLKALAGNPNVALVTSLLDYYGLPADVPGMTDRPPGLSLARVKHVEAAMAGQLNDARIQVHLQMHEFEAMLYADPTLCGAYLRNEKLTKSW